ncbi:MAG: deoxyribodipyrimidine photolyase [Deltaproteobacteria bacterium]|jgi:deoxyribodipyrimidine photo-lyase|nr:deoxyribodipyrimidine photolyase [Deltaproteobacteria bacterium]MBW2496458.1 deoxyribodipyrimidine photolyase [Deltaproteobacteria bacterium]
MLPADRLGDRRPLPLPDPGPTSATRWIEAHLGDLACDRAPASADFRGGQTAADAALDAFSVAGYARRRNTVWPPSRRGASRLSPYIRHGLLPLGRVWNSVEAGPPADVAKFRDELLWQEYARHLYARLGGRLGRSLRWEPPVAQESKNGPDQVLDPEMACLAACREELEEKGWIVNQTRMWLASHWSLRRQARWQEGEDYFFRHLLDGSRAANRLGWQWTSGSASGRPYAFGRHQVMRRAPTFCRGCALRDACPIEAGQEIGEGAAIEPREAALRRDSELAATAGPSIVERAGAPDAVWLTAESLGDADPALRAHPDRPAVFVFDVPLLARLGLSRKRLIFLVETLADLGLRRMLEIHRGDPTLVLRNRRLSTTYAPVPGARRRREELDVVALHPWPWLVRPHDGPIGSYSAWRKGLEGRVSVEPGQVARPRA